MNILAEKRILIGVTGGIAVYKTVEIVSRLVKAQADVRVLMTEAAQKFVSPLTFGAMSGHAPITDLWQLYEGEKIGHVTLAHKADLLSLIHI